jgi:phosphatidylinositol-4,5-bisphosphate 3-kinase
MFGVRMLDHIDDKELANYLLQLVAALKHEPHHYSPLAAFLVRRGLGARHSLGRRLYWLLKVY